MKRVGALGTPLPQADSSPTFPMWKRLSSGLLPERVTFGMWDSWVSEVIPKEGCPQGWGFFSSVYSIKYMRELQHKRLGLSETSRPSWGSQHLTSCARMQPALYTLKPRQWPRQPQTAARTTVSRLPTLASLSLVLYSGDHFLLLTHCPLRILASLFSDHLLSLRASFKGTLPQLQCEAWWYLALSKSTWSKL